MTISPNPDIESHPGGGTVTFNFGASASGGTGSYTYTWSTGATGDSTSFNEHAFASEETDGSVSVTVHDGVTTASDSADWIADGF